MADNPKTKAVQEAIAQLMERINEIDPDFDLGITRTSTLKPAERFSDWHDRFRDGGGFSKGFGKAGG